MKSGNPGYAIFGGSFDPPHLGHRSVAQAVLGALPIDEVIWVPNYRNPLRRKAFANPHERLQMCQLATENLEGMAVSDIEVSRGVRSYTIETVEEFLVVKPGNIWIILGADALDSIMEWKEPAKLLRLCRVATLVRPGTNLERVLSVLHEDMRDSIDVVEMPPHRASSSQIRDDVFREASPELMLEPSVWNYIKEKGLYRDQETD